MNAKLVPRRYKIEHDANQYTYFIQFVWDLNKWGIEGPGSGQYLTTNLVYDWPGPDTAIFDTPEQALEWWKENVNAR